MECGVYTAV